MSNFVFCRGCGKEIHADADNCPHCGAPQMVGGKKSRTTAMLLAFLLGGVGAHKFYMGKAGMGIVYLLFCLTCIPAVIAFIEGIIYACKTDAEFQKMCK